MRYRIHGDDTWREAEVVNISATGLLFNSIESAARGTRMDISVNLPSTAHVPGIIRVVAPATILRCCRVDESRTGFQLAARLTAPRILRR
jgi:hypothetical protein